ncbi:PLD-like domain protein [Bacteriovorax sp. BAL6_X]|uniref:phospholipase D-like domain-containing protein n=1 Tax=Bacteriovorax sp. BAL6_X TaxID=1201290 RepID=UPI000386B847|nr:phosphatidylserine/phosphatidylglycerophosphate/cardiolipin synthase family protein [Bacteriovorax sp. BAL6_X]EPZ51900.1 PLD-like domain protein [Bacteriovorax sp. BAL6_X]
MYEKFILIFIMATNALALQIPFIDRDYIIDHSSENRATYSYKKDEYGRLENTKWFELDWHLLQDDYQTNYKAYINEYSGTTFNEAKINYYSQFNFSNEMRHHLVDEYPLKEWGFLNHSPIRKKLNNLSLFSKDYNKIDYNNLVHPYFTIDFQNRMDEVSKSQLSFGNKIKVLENSHSYKKKIDLIQNAKSEILMSSLSFVCDSSVKTLINELIKAHHRDVKVYVMDDKMMSKALGHNECPNKLKKNGVQIIRANDFWNHNGRTVYHHKKLVVDGKIAIIGGQNQLNADNLSQDTDFKNKDIDVLIEGPIVTDIAIGFLKDWQYFRKKIFLVNRADLSSELNYYKARLKWEKDNNLRGQDHYHEVLKNKETRMKGVCRFIQQSPYEHQTNIGDAYLLALNNIDKYLGIMDPIRSDTYYKSVLKDAPLIEKFDTFKVFNKLHNKIKDLQERGVSLDFITTGTDMTGNEIIDINNEEIKKLILNKKISDKALIKKIKKRLKSIKKWNDYFGEAHFENLINDYSAFNNTRVWLHISFLHSKVFYFDRILASIGSYNFQHNATDHSYENTLLCLDKELNKELDEVFIRDMANSVPLKFNKLE